MHIEALLQAADQAAYGHQGRYLTDNIPIIL